MGIKIYFHVFIEQKSLTFNVIQMELLLQIIKFNIFIIGDNKDNETMQEWIIKYGSDVMSK